MSEGDQDFAALRRLLALKRYEQPPPGYFNTFSSQVIARIEAGEGAQAGMFQRIFGSPTWLQQLWNALGTTTVMARAIGAGVCTLLLAGVAYSVRPEGPPDLPGPAVAAAHHLQAVDFRSSGHPGPFDHFPRLSVSDGIPEPTGPFINVSLPGAN